MIHIQLSIDILIWKQFHHIHFGSLKEIRWAELTQKYGKHYHSGHGSTTQLTITVTKRRVFMMTSSNGNIFCVTGPLCGPGEFPTQRPVTRSFDVFFDLRLNKRLSKQPWGWWFETPSWSLWRHCNVLIRNKDRQQIRLNVPAITCRWDQNTEPLMLWSTLGTLSGNPLKRTFLWGLQFDCISIIQVTQEGRDGTFHWKHTFPPAGSWKWFVRGSSNWWPTFVFIDQDFS